MMMVMLMVLMMSVVLVPDCPLDALVYELSHPRRVTPCGIVPADEFVVCAGPVLTLPHALAPVNLRCLALRAELWVPHVANLPRQRLVHSVQRVHGAECRRV